MVKIIDERIRRKLASIRLAFRGVVTLVKAAGAIQLVQGEGVSGETLQGVEYFQHFGFTSNPPAGTMFVTIPLGGKTAHCVIVASENAASRLQDLQSGEAATYNAFGMKVHLTKDGIVVDGGGKPMAINNITDLNVDGNIVASGDISDQGNKSMAGMRSVFNLHPHAVSGSVAAAPEAPM